MIKSTSSCTEEGRIKWREKWRIVIDCRKLNERGKEDNFPLPNITEILDSLAGSVYFKHLDMSQGYY